jgi:hypothetical protein
MTTMAVNRGPDGRDDSGALGASVCPSSMRREVAVNGQGLQKPLLTDRPDSRGDGVCPALLWKRVLDDRQCRPMVDGIYDRKLTADHDPMSAVPIEAIEQNVRPCTFVVRSHQSKVRLFLRQRVQPLPILGRPQDDRSGTGFRGSHFGSACRPHDSRAGRRRPGEAAQRVSGTADRRRASSDRLYRFRSG